MTKKSPISKRLKEARLDAKLSQKQFGIAIGIDQFVASPRMNQYETGKHAPDFDVLEKIAKVLKKPTSYFYTGDFNSTETLNQLGEETMRQLLQVK